MSTSRKARTRSSRKSRPSSTVLQPARPFPELIALRARARKEADTIASALEHLPPLDRATMGAQQFPFNEVASSEAVQATVAKIVRQRIESPWSDVHAALVKTDENGKGYAEFMDAYRDVAFLVGVEYAVRSFPGWWPLVQKLEPSEQEAIGAIVRGTALCLGGKDAE